MFFLRDSSAENNWVDIQVFNQLHAEVAQIMWTLSNCSELVVHAKSFSRVSRCKSVQGSNSPHPIRVFFSHHVFFRIGSLTNSVTNSVLTFKIGNGRENSH
jgi:hypothetical protein